MDDVIERIRKEIREDQAPYFTPDDFEYYLKKHGGDIEAVVYEMLIIKSEDSTITVSGLSTKDTSSYFKRLAAMHKRFNSCTLGG